MTDTAHSIVAAAAEEVAGRPASEVRPEDRLTEDLSLDSLDFLRFVQTVEDMAHVVISDELGARAKTVADMTAILRELRAGQTG